MHAIFQRPPRLAPIPKALRALAGADGIIEVVSEFWYTDAVREWIHSVKYASHLEKLQVLIRHTQPSWQGPSGECSWVTPVPTHWRRFHQRRFNTAEVLALQMSRWLDVPMVHSLQKTKAVVPQSTLKRKLRSKNVRGAYQANGWLGHQKGGGGKLLLVDDVYTTGATLQACASSVTKSYGLACCAWTLLRAAP